jgi:TRAP-type transport system periplasmic protein
MKEVRAMKKRSCCLVLVFFLLVGFSVSSFAAETIKLKFANYYHPSHRNAVVASQFCDEIKKRTNGRVEIAYFPGGTLATHPKMFQAVSTGVADIGLANLAATRGRFPVMEAMDLPYGFPSGWVSTHVANDFYNKYKPKEFDSVHVLYFNACGPNVVFTSKTPVRKLEDMRGVKLRAVSRVADIVKALGGTPMPIEMADIYESLNKGVVEGSYGPIEQILGYKLGGIVKYATPPLQVGSVFTFYVVMNKAKWESLPADVKKIFTEVAAEWAEKQGVTWNEIDRESIEYFTKSGGQLIYLSDQEGAKWKKAVEPVFADYKKDMAGAGFKAPDMDAYFQFISERLSYWTNKEKESKIPFPFK